MISDSVIDAPMMVAAISVATPMLTAEIEAAVMDPPLIVAALISVESTMPETTSPAARSEASIVPATISELSIVPALMTEPASQVTGFQLVPSNWLI
jgi:hypothetical protein